jgi:hypothetical protein
MAHGPRAATERPDGLQRRHDEDMKTPDHGREVLFVYAALKGVMEHGDAGAYFGSLLGLGIHVQEAQALGLLDDKWNPTDRGREVYAAKNLQDLPTTKLSRAYLWDWEDRLVRDVDR